VELSERSEILQTLHHLPALDMDQIITQVPFFIFPPPFFLRSPSFLLTATLLLTLVSYSFSAGISAGRVHFFPVPSFLEPCKTCIHTHTHTHTHRRKFFATKFKPGICYEGSLCQKRPISKGNETYRFLLDDVQARDFQYRFLPPSPSPSPSPSSLSPFLPPCP